MFSSDPLYNFYVVYLDSKGLSKGAKTLMKISEQCFDDFKYGYENDYDFKSKIDKMALIEMRNTKIDDVLDKGDLL